MPYTLRQARYLFSKGSPLTAEQKAKMADEIRADPSIERNRKGSPQMKRVTARRKK